MDKNHLKKNVPSYLSSVYLLMMWPQGEILTSAKQSLYVDVWVKMTLSVKPHPS